jgi:hypothetical protein
LVDVPRYQKIWRERHGYYSMNMVTTRGCPYHCNWCAKPIWGQRYNSRSPENVAAEMKWLKDVYRPDHIWFADDILGLKPGWIERFGQQAHEQDAVVPFKCLLRADLVKPSVVAGLKMAGCRTVWMGAESGAQSVLDAMDKGTTVEQIHTARRLLGAAGIEVAFFLQFGYPGETRADVGLRCVVRETLPDDIAFGSYPQPGTKFYERVRGQLGAKQNWVDSDDLAMLYEGPFPQPFYRVLHRTVHREFRLRRALRLLRQDLGAPQRWRLRHLRALVSIPYQWLGWQFNRLRLNTFKPNPAPGRPVSEGNALTSMTKRTVVLLQPAGGLLDHAAGAGSRRLQRSTARATTCASSTGAWCPHPRRGRATPRPRFSALGDDPGAWA